MVEIPRQMTDTQKAVPVVHGKPINPFPFTRLGRLCGGISIDSLHAAFTDWGTHLSGSGAAQIAQITDLELTFLLASGGHNVGIVNPPSVLEHSYQVLKRACNTCNLDPDMWFTTALKHEGSWWLNWAKWLLAGFGYSVTARSLNATRQGVTAPSTYVLQK